jgi:hypothetical protein
MSFEQCQSVTALMKGFEKTWFIAGGWAIDLFIDGVCQDSCRI